ncbi:transmembrane protein 135-like [Penaeus monodon]|uniref:transmembrane protein 135-like n=1 Tax=Penaeus monodon TaxID=6687 RepID=UPI0018A72618|nr:transmembrane protein 135-like [Penaeus monodon]
MANLSKIVSYSCYELGHCWDHSCSKASFEICIIGFIESCKIYGVVYLLTWLVKGRKITLEYGRKILKDYVRSVCFLTTNAFGYIGSFCVIRKILQHVNFLSASFLPGFVGSVLAINVERVERRPLLAVYVANVASECLWNSAVANGYAKSIPRGEILIFAGTMAVLGYSFRSATPLSKTINSILQLFLGRGESGKMIAARQEGPAPDGALPAIFPRMSWVQKILQIFRGRHHACPHKGGCLPYFTWTALRGFSQGFLLQLAVKIIPSLPRLLGRPSKIYDLLTNPHNFQAGIFLAWFMSVFKGTCCLGRWWSGKDEAAHGAVAGVLSALSMYFYSAPSLALYIMWKAIESIYEKGCDDGYLPRIPGSVEFLYALCTGYLFHSAVWESFNMKPSYWRFLDRLTWSRMSEYNRHLLTPYGLESSKEFANYWPKYRLDHVTDSFMQEFQEVIARGRY